MTNDLEQRPTPFFSSIFLEEEHPLIDLVLHNATADQLRSVVIELRRQKFELERQRDALQDQLSEANGLLKHYEKVRDPYVDVARQRDALMEALEELYSYYDAYDSTVSATTMKESSLVLASIKSGKKP